MKVIFKNKIFSKFVFVPSILFYCFINAASAQISIVQCGWDKACTIADLILSSSLLAEFIIKFIFPALFFIGSFIALIPMIKDPDNPSNRAESKRRFKILLIGTGLVVGSYMIIISILSLFGVRTDILEKTLSNNYNSHHNSIYLDRDFIANVNITSYSFFTDKAFAIKNPLESTSVQNVLLSVLNGVVFVAMIAGGYCVVRGGFMLVWAYQNPNNTSVDYIKKGKWWILSGMIIWTVFFSGQYIIDVIYNSMADFTQSTKS